MQMNATELVCHSLRLCKDLDDYFAKQRFNINNSIPFSHLPINAQLNDRIRILLKKRIDESMSRKERLKSIWNSLANNNSNQEQTK